MKAEVFLRRIFWEWRSRWLVASVLLLGICVIYLMTRPDSVVEAVGLDLISKDDHGAGFSSSLTYVFRKPTNDPQVFANAVERLRNSPLINDHGFHRRTDASSNSTKNVEFSNSSWTIRVSDHPDTVVVDYYGGF